MICELKTIAKAQFSLHENTNIYCVKNALHFSKETKIQLARQRGKLHTLSPMQKRMLCENCKTMFMQAFYEINQYIYFSKLHEMIICQLYNALLQDLEDLNLALEAVEGSHYERIKKFIATTNSAVYHLNTNCDVNAKQFVCEEYSAKFLLDLYDLELNGLVEPILDIGCGKYGLLIRYLQTYGLRAVGFDRNADQENIAVMDWLTYEYGENTWGLIISNLSFSSHFLYHHLHNESIANLYGATYMNILKSLKKNGSWIYAPSIEFFENLLPDDLYSVERVKIHEDFSRTTIVKL